MPFKTLRVGIEIAWNMPHAFMGTIISAPSLRSLICIPTLTKFGVYGDWRCLLTPRHLDVLEQCIRARASSGAPPLVVLAMGRFYTRGAYTVTETMAALKRIASVLAEVSPTTALRLVSSPYPDEVDMSGFTTSAPVRVERVTNDEW